MSNAEKIGLWVETEGKHTGRLVIDMPPTWNHMMLGLPGSKFDAKTRRYTIPKTWQSLLSLKALSAEIRWPLAPDLEVQEWGKEQGRAWGTLTRASAVVRSSDEKLDGYYLHQVDGAAWLLAAPEAGTGRLLQDETGAGKTVTIIRAICEGQIPGPILIVAVESTMETAWQHDLNQWAPHLRVEQVTGTVVARRKTLKRLAEGEIDVAIIGHTNLKSHTRFKYFPGTALRRCIACGGAPLTSGQTDDKGKPLPDIDYHTEADVHQVAEGRWIGRCGRESCTWLTDSSEDRAAIEEQVLAHRATGRKITELTEAQCQVHRKELNDIPLQLVVVDEIHRAMNPQSQLSQAIWGVTEYSANGTKVPHHRRWGATGTPVSKRSEQAWAPLHWVNPLGYPAKGEWVSYFCLEERGWDGYPRCDRFQPARIPEFQASYRAMTRRVLKEQVLTSLPPRIRWNGMERRVEMGKAQRDQYRQMRDEMILQLGEGLITAANAANKAGRLTMLASGCGVPDPGNTLGGQQKMLMTTPSCKLDAILADFRDGVFDDQQIGMTFASAQVLYMIRKGLVEAGVLRDGDISMIAGTMSKDEVDRSVKEFQSGKRRVVMLTYAKGGTGITLTAASSVLVVQRDWNPINNLQGMDRFYRIGSERHDVINIFDYVTKGTNEIAQLKRLEQNAATLEEIVQDRPRMAEWFS